MEIKTKTGVFLTIRLRAACVRSDTVAPFIHTRRSPRHTPALSAAPPLTRLTEKRPFSPAATGADLASSRHTTRRPGEALATLRRCEVDAQAGDGIFGDVAEPGWSAASALARSDNALEVATLVEDLLVGFPIQDQ